MDILIPMGILLLNADVIDFRKSYVKYVGRLDCDRLLKVVFALDL